MVIGLKGNKYELFPNIISERGFYVNTLKNIFPYFHKENEGIREVLKPD